MLVLQWATIPGEHRERERMRRALADAAGPSSPGTRLLDVHLASDFRTIRRPAGK